MADKKVNPMQLYKLLPQTNCKKCGMTCMAFATRLALREVELKECTPLFEEEQYKDQLTQLQNLILPLLDTEETGIKLDETKCTGCGNCVVVCPVDASAEPDTASGKAARTTKTVFRVEDGTVKMINLEKCRRFPPERMNCRVCEQGCYVNAIEIW
ncbi:MAG: (Fe-S)-binding protein [Candidatus Hermodarchaeia archaeon]|jgi:4Fe-4S ferredoxin